MGAAPPWMKTWTGQGPRPGPGSGVHTLRNRQSSLCAAGHEKPGACGQAGPKALAFSVPGAHAAAGCGAAQRSGPTGGRAYGTPRKARQPGPEICGRPAEPSRGGAGRGTAHPLHGTQRGADHRAGLAHRRERAGQQQAGCEEEQARPHGHGRGQ